MKKQLREMVIALSALFAFALVFLGAANLLNENPVGIIECGFALLISVPVVILSNREEKA